MIIANATRCSSIYGGNLPTHPYSVNKDGRGPAWSNSLFEDNAEFGLGMRLTIDKQNEYARELLSQLEGTLGKTLVNDLLNADQSDEAGIQAQRERVEQLKKKLKGKKDPQAKDLLSLADILVKRSVWIVGGDGWAYDIGYGGLDHVLASGRNVNVLVLDTQVYSNTGGQSSKATPLGAVAKFAANGKAIPRKDLGMIAMSYGYIYVAQVAMGSSDMQTLRAFREADAFDGPSLILAYSPCINHGYDLIDGLKHQDLAVKSGLWPLYRYNPGNIDQGKNPLKLDSKDPSISVKEAAYTETRYSMLALSDEDRAERLMKNAQEDVDTRWELYKQMASIRYNGNGQS
jgi:pyruvate-ferredoxin/flavodoxin oxidoreductase